MEDHKGKRQYIASITGGLPKEKNPYKGKMMRKISRLIVLSKEEGNDLTRELETSILGFQKSEKVGGTSNEIFPLVIKDTIANFDVSRILINEKIFCNIMYEVLFE